MAAEAPWPAEAERARSFLVFPFRNLTRTPELEWLIDGSVALLADALRQWQELSVVPETRLYPALRRRGLTSGDVLDAELVRQIAVETGGWTVVTGDVMVTGGRVQVRARAYDVVTERELTRAAEEADADEDIRALYERVALGLLGPEDLARRPDLVRASTTTQSLEAYKAYLSARRHWEQMEVDAALEAARAAVRLDSTFALAHAAVATAWAGRIRMLGEIDPEMATVPLDPRSEFNHALRRAVALSSRLPWRERLLVQATDAYYRAQFAAARQAAEQLVAADSTDTDALLVLAGVELMDAVLATVDGVEYRRGSVNAALRLGKRLTMLDAARLEIYPILTAAYLEASGYWTGSLLWLMGLREQPASLLDWAQQVMRADRQFVPILRDSMELIPVLPLDSLRTISDSVLREAQARARAAARGWVDTWMAAGPATPYAHAVAASVYELDGDVEEALETLLRAERLEGTPRQRYAVRRMVLLGKLGRNTEAYALLDSVWEAEWLQTTPFSMGFPRDDYVARAWAVGLFLEHGDLTRADAASELLATVLAMRVPEENVAGVAAAVLTGTLERPSRQWWAFSAGELPPTLLRPALVTLLRNIDRLPPAGRLAGILPQLIRGAANGVLREERLDLAARAVDAAFALATLAREDLALPLGEVAVEIDPSLRPRLEEAPWYRNRTREPAPQ